MKGWAARLPQRFSSAEWITDTYFQLRVEFLKFGLGGKRCLWQSPVWFWWELVTNPTLHTHTHTHKRTQTAAFSPSTWSTALTPPGGRRIVILPSLAPSICRSERCGCWGVLFSCSLISLSRLVDVCLLLLKLSDLPKPFVFSCGLHFKAPSFSQSASLMGDKMDLLAEKQGTAEAHKHTPTVFAGTVKRGERWGWPLSVSLDMPRSRRAALHEVRDDLLGSGLKTR